MNGATAMELAVGAGADLAFGDPHWLPHPVQGIGWLIRSLEHGLRRNLLRPDCRCGSGPHNLGRHCWFHRTDVALGWLPCRGLLDLSGYCLAVRDLDQHAGQVIDALRSGNIEVARNRSCLYRRTRYG